VCRFFSDDWSPAWNILPRISTMKWALQRKSPAFREGRASSSLRLKA
jgi:hypothetical protein